MYCISINYKNTPEDIRAKISFTSKEKEGLLNDLKEKNIISGAVLVSTCNRTELYFDSFDEDYEKIILSLSNFKNIDSELIKKYGLFFENDSAIRHLFRVVFGLESMVLGEDEIFHQVKEAYLFSDEKEFLNKELNIIFQDAFHAEKLSKQQTLFKKTPVSIGTLTANFISDYLGDEKNGEVLIIGASGAIGSVVARDLIDKGISVTGTTRKTHHSNGYYVIDSDKINWVPYEERLLVLKDMAVIVSATKSPHYTITKDEFLSSDGMAGLIIDLSVPFDIDREIASQNVKVLGIDYFKKLSLKNNEEKKNSIGAAEDVLNAELEKTYKKLFLDRTLKQKAFIKLNGETKKEIFSLKDILSYETFKKLVSEIIDFEE